MRGAAGGGQFVDDQQQWVSIVAAELRRAPPPAAGAACALRARQGCRPRDTVRPAARCDEGVSWGCAGGAVWTAGGCRGAFECGGAAVECDHHRPYNVCPGCGADG
eukprot:gene30733-33093_t